MLEDRRTVICFPFAGDSVGGSHVSVLGLLRRLDRTRFRPLIVVEVPDGRIARMFLEFDPVADPGANGAPVAPGQPFGARKFLRTLSGVSARMRFLREHHVDVVHSNDGRTHANWGPPSRLAGVPLLWHHRADPAALGLRLAAPLLARRVLTVSSFALPRPGLWSAAHKSEVVHSPFDTDVHVNREDARRKLVLELGLDERTLIIGFFGSFVRRKRPLLFVDAVARLRELVDRPVVGLMFGEAKDPAVGAALQQRVADNEGSIRMMGFRPNGAFWIGGCDQLMVPAVGEPFGRTLIEAMLVGTPVVAAESGGNIEALAGGLGILVPPDDAEGLARAAADLAKSPERLEEIVREARSNARRRFGEEQHAARVSEIYEELAGKSRRGAPAAAVA